MTTLAGVGQAGFKDGAAVAAQVGKSSYIFSYLYCVLDTSATLIGT